MPDQMTSAQPIGDVPAAIESAYDDYLRAFLEITRRAKTVFERQNWMEGQENIRERLDLYDASLEAIIGALRDCHGTGILSRHNWKSYKQGFYRRISTREDIDLAESFYNSVTRGIFHTVGIDRELEFFHLHESDVMHEDSVAVYRSYVVDGETQPVVARMLRESGLSAEFENLDRDAERVSQEIDLRLWPIKASDAPFVIQIIDSFFFRNKVAYAVGRILSDARCLPLAIPLYSGGDGMYVDTVLLDEEDVDVVFSFAFSSFHVDIVSHHSLISFLHSILPHKPVSELYSSIGFDRYAKTIFYRNLHRFVHLSKETFEIAPGKEGAVMTCFTLPSFDFVFKIIKDKPCFVRSGMQTAKEITRDAVIARYDFVCHRDRVGRLVDTQEFENLRFKEKRFRPELLDEFALVAHRAIEIRDGSVILRHCFVQRKVTPFPIFLREEKDPEKIRRVVIDFGFFIKDLAGTGIFPSDLFNTWNYGVTSYARVVLFDYDDVLPLEDVQFRIKPEPRDDFERAAPEEEWIVSGPDDFFIDEMNLFSGVPSPLKGIFLSVHSDLYTLEFWRSMKDKLNRGELADIYPYSRQKRFVNRHHLV